MSYILLTPIKNESEYIPQLKKSVYSQTLQPIIWVIIDSGSTDDSFSQLESTFSNEKHVHIIKQKRFFEVGYGHKNFAQAINEGYAYAKQRCSQQGSSFNFIGKTDATPILSKNYFEALMAEMVKDPHLAITCGMQYVKVKNKLIEMSPISNLSLTGFNDIRLYRKNFFEKNSGYPLAPSPDSVLLIKAIHGKYSVSQIKTTFFIKPRLGGSKIGIWKGNLLLGKNMYILGYPPILMLLNAFHRTLCYPPHYQILPIMVGYFTNTIKKTEKINDAEILEYFNKERIHEILSAVFS